MAFMLGSFAGGLWQGASSAMSLAREYQAFQTQQAQVDAANQVANLQQQDSVNANVPGYDPTTGKPVPQQIAPGDASTGLITTGDDTGSGPTSGTGTGDKVTSSDLPTPKSGSGVKKTSWPPKRDNTGVPPPPADAGRPANQGIPTGGPASAAGVPGAAGGPSGDPVYGPAGPPTSTGAQPPATPTDQPQPPTDQPQPDDKSAVGIGGKPAEPATTTLKRVGRAIGGALRTSSGTGRVDPTTGAPTDASADPYTGATAPVQAPLYSTPPVNAAGVQGPAGSPSGPAPSRPVATDDYGRPIQPTSPVPADAPTTQPVGGYLGQGPVGRALTPPTSQAVPTTRSGAPLSGDNAINWAQEQARKSGQEVPVPNGNGLVARPNGGLYTPGGGFGGRGQQGALPTSNQFAGPGVPTDTGPAQPPSSAVQGDVAAIQQGIQNVRQSQGAQPPGTATGAGPVAGTPPPATPATTPPPGSGTYDFSHSPTAAIAPAKAPTTATGAQTQQQPGPVTVPATGGKVSGATSDSGTTGDTGRGQVVPGPPSAQKGPSTQSEKTPPALSPQVNPNFWSRLQQQDPEYANLVKQVVDKVGGGQVSYENVAAILKRESGFNRNPALGPFGEHGVMQVMPQTQQAMMKYLGQNVNPDSLEGSLTLGVAYLRYLAVDQGLGANSAQTNLAYMRGPGAVQEVARTGLDRARQGPLKNALGWLDDMYGNHIQLSDGQFTGGHDGPNGTHYSPDQIIRAGNGPGGPDALLNVVSTTGPAGLGMSGRWASAQAAVERAAIMKGDYNALPHISEWFAQQSHQGAVSNLIAAHSALSAGDGQGAINALARAHAFFPDGVMGRFGLDKSGNVWGERFDEGSGQRIGQPFQINAESLVPQIVRLQNPNNYIQTLDAHRKAAAGINLDNARADYEGQRPELEIMKAEIPAQTAAANRESREAIAAANRTSREQIAANKPGTGDKDYSSQDQVAANRTTNQVYKPDNKPDDVSDQDYSAMSSLHTQLVKAPRSGGAGLTSANAQMIASGVRARTIKPVLSTDANGNQGYGLYDASDVGDDGKPKDGAHPHAYLPKAEGDQVLRNFVRGPGAGSGKGQQHTAISPVGAGLGTAMAANQGAGQGLASQAIPTSGQAPLQSAPQSMAA